MKELGFKLYLKSPYIFKRLLANIEAIRRDYYRRASDNRNMDDQENIINRMMVYESSSSLENFNNLLEYANRNVQFYHKKIPKRINTLREIESIDLLTKNMIRENRDSLIADNTSVKIDLWNGNTSGSTGSPLAFYKDRKTMKSERESYDKYYEFLGCDIHRNRVRISGVKVATFERKKPPYWLYIDKYKQLQCSAYHISKASYQDYLNEFKKRKVNLGTGFPSGWTALAEAMTEDNITFEGLKAIITDSEGLSDKNKIKIEKAFKCPVYRTYGLGEVGMCAVECEQGNYHILPTHYVEIIDQNGNLQPDGEEGEIVVTDFNSQQYPYIRYVTGDLGIMEHKQCSCGFKTPYLTEITGRIEDYILTKDGRKISRLSKIVAPAVGIKESQIIQESLGLMIINIIPDINFEEESMKKVMDMAKEFVGDMEVRWNRVDQLERMPSGKLKFLIRRV